MSSIPELCTNCQHKEVCKFQEEFTQALKGVEAASFGGTRMKMTQEENWIQDVKNLDWVKVNVQCLKFLAKVL